MEFLKKADHPEPYIAYIHELSKQHYDANRFVEAGLTLLLHGNLLNPSSSNILPQQLKYPEQSELKRKEKIYMKAINHFDKGKEYERAIGLLKQLIHIYEDVEPQYTILSSLLKSQSSFFEKIVTVERYPPEYFRVFFYGRGFPPSLQVFPFPLDFSLLSPFPFPSL